MLIDRLQDPADLFYKEVMSCNKMVSSRKAKAEAKEMLHSALTSILIMLIMNAILFCNSA